ncbi:hypothetical protein ZIOFF_019966 [Zingiber officinale]|uniref:Uncharacterized protein n=1 Tax=Zingiber officinale TaxID=94328 RepID=A0A8J5LJX2_ZINOF|nr:hypothetical protein ZIOFF_019966 [Zingiber officinale]
MLLFNESTRSRRARHSGPIDQLFACLCLPVSLANRDSFGGGERIGSRVLPAMDSQILIALALSLVGGFSTSIGGFLVVLSDAPDLRMLGILQFFVGALFFASVVNLIPEPSFVETTEKKNGDESAKRMVTKDQHQILFSGIITAVGISLHNFPEGMAVFLGSMKGDMVVFVATFTDFLKLIGLRVGINLALAIALHNIPEGVAVALPVYFATRSKWQAFRLATLSGFAEPLGVIFVAYLFPRSLSPEVLEGLLGSVGGVMAFLTLHEMLPLAFEYAGHKKAVQAVFVGMAFMSARVPFGKLSSWVDGIGQRSSGNKVWREREVEVLPPSSKGHQGRGLGNEAETQFHSSFYLSSGAADNLPHLR